MAFSPRTSAGVGSIPGAPSSIGRYQILDLIATGGMAEVYLARHGEMSGYETIVVVKRILPHLARDARFIEMFLDEGRIAAALDHPNIAKIIEVGHAGQEYFMAMELVQGESLAGVVNEAKEKNLHIAPSLACLMIAHAAAGLHHAHTLTDANGQPLNIVHRDVSPQNILVSFEGAVKVIDFGVARALGRVTQTKTGGVKGKIAYMAPEQARGEPVDQRTDVFALGVVLWETLTGRRLFARETELATMRAILDEPYPQATEFVPLKPMLAGIVSRALEREASARFESAQELETALEKYIATEGFIGTGDLARQMKALFPEEHLRWKRWVRGALALATPPGGAARRVATEEGGVPTLVLKPGARSGGASGPIIQVGSPPRLDAAPSARLVVPTPRPWNDAPTAVAGASPAHAVTPVPRGPFAAESTVRLQSSRRLWPYLGAVWLLLVGGGLVVGLLYSRPDRNAHAPVQRAVPEAAPMVSPASTTVPAPTATSVRPVVPIIEPLGPKAPPPTAGGERPAGAARPSEPAEATAAGTSTVDDVSRNTFSGRTSSDQNSSRTSGDREGSRSRKEKKPGGGKLKAGQQAPGTEQANPGFKPNPF